jgi:hypothetical protein
VILRSRTTDGKHGAPLVEPPTGTRTVTDTERSCGECSLCCTVLRVDEIAKLGGTPCIHLLPSDDAGDGCCGIHDTRPGICRGYRCLWLRGRLGEQDRPDRLGAVLDLVPTGTGLRLSIREAHPGVFDRSKRLQEIAADFREHLPVRITDVHDVLDPDRPFRVLLAAGQEQKVTGDVVTTLQDGVETESRRSPWPERLARRASLAWHGYKLRRLGSR